MKVSSLSFKNIGPYGNSFVTLSIPEDPSLILIQGVNGMGKSTLIEALTFGIYGESPKRALKDLPNRINGGAHTIVKLRTTDDQYVEIERGIQPAFLEVTIDKIPIPASKKPQMNKDISNKYAKLAVDVFCNVISLSISDFKSFITMSPSDRKSVV